LARAADHLSAVGVEIVNIEMGMGIYQHLLLLHRLGAAIRRLKTALAEML
jgi:hypothetical protein